MPHRSTARLLAPLALAAAALAVILVVSGSGSGSSSKSASSTAASSTRQAGGAKSKAVARATPRKPRAKSRTYVVQANDTLSTIATRTNVSLATLQELNPNVDPQGLHAGQKLRIK
jgi:LysM repeat protein